MNNQTHNQSDRTAALRNELVATVNATPYMKKAPSRAQTFFAAVVVFLIAGAVTGGVTSAALALSSDTSPGSPSDETVTVNVDAITANFITDDTTLFGTPFILTGVGHTVIELGTPPEGADSVAIAIGCLDAGLITTAFNGSISSTMQCSQEDSQTSGHNGAYYFDVDGNEAQTLTIRSGGANRYAVWASWASEAAEPEVSAAQSEELADGEITREEYEAAFDRFASCMTEAGHPLQAINRAGTVITALLSSEAVSSGVDRQCYAAEFREVDIAWQTTHAD